MIEQIPALNLTGTDPATLGWHRETTFLRSYPPRGAPNIFVVGAYSGTIAGLLIEQLPEARHWLFEPQDWACRQLAGKFGHLPNVRILPFGLGDRSGIFRMGLYQTDTCSFTRGPVPLKDLPVRSPGGWFDGEIVEFGEFMGREGLRDVYYASLNIEGYEYVLLPHWAKTGWLARIQTLGISWHDARYNSSISGPFTWLGQPLPVFEDLQPMLEETHELVLSIDNWQSWVRKEARP